MKQKEVDSVASQLLNVEQMVQTIDSKQNEKQVLDALRTGKDALAKMQRETTVDNTLNLMDQIQEQNETQKDLTI